MISESVKTFVMAHRTEDVRQLALKYHAGGASSTTGAGSSCAANTTGSSSNGAEEGHFDLSFALDQIKGWQTARQKVPTWASNDGIVYPPHLNMEQCSSEPTARYKAHVLARLMGADAAKATLADLTGGFGVDFSFMSASFGHAVYVEQNEHLCRIAAHNLRVLGRSNAEVVCGDGVEYLRDMPSSMGHSQQPDRPVIIYLDPARRDDHGRKVAALSDCHPDVTLLRDELMAKARILMVKLSPMLDIHAALEALAPTGRGAEVHIVCSGGECKELMLVLTHEDTPLRMVCTDDDNEFSYQVGEEIAKPLSSKFCSSTDDIRGTLLVPHAGIMKAQCFDEVAARYALSQVSKTSHLFVAVSPESSFSEQQTRPVSGFPGRQFRILRTTTMNKRDLRQALAGMTQANIAVRHFPMTADQLRQKLKLRDGGSHYLFATTCAEKHIIIVCERI